MMVDRQRSVARSGPSTDLYSVLDKRLQPTTTLYVVGPLGRGFYFRLPILCNAVNAPEINILSRFSKSLCAARSAKVPLETKLNYDAARLEYKCI